MRKYFSILLLITYSFSVFQLNEYIKIPILVKHFQEHQQKNPKLDLTVFFQNHYSIKNSNDSDSDKDSRLPFKSNDGTCHFCLNIAFYNQIQTIVFENKLVLKSFKKPTFCYTFTFISDFHSAIWQPPKIC